MPTRGQKLVLGRILPFLCIKHRYTRNTKTDNILLVLKFHDGGEVIMIKRLRKHCFRMKNLAAPCRLGCYREEQDSRSIRSRTGD